MSGEGFNLTSKQIAQLKHQELILKQKKQALIDGLPHRYQFKWYTWARAFYESTNKMNLLCAGNQVSKSSTQIRKAIEWASNRSLWPKLWKDRPRQFWYLYPSKDVATAEFLKKWEPIFLPRNEFKKHPDFGWKEEYVSNKISAIHFLNGVSIYFKTYAQDSQSLQTGTCDAIFGDEEMPEELYPELALRLAATDGYFHAAFTATLNQDFWKRAIEADGKDENFPTAFKQQISMYDCMFYEDGSLGAYTEERIEKIKAMCGSEAEIQRRVYGKFVASEGRMYPSFDANKHYTKEFSIKTDHRIYAAVDPGGGGSSHPAAILFLALESDLKRAVIFKTWRGDQIITTNGDILTKYLELRGNLNLLGSCYDFAAKDFGTISQRMGIQFSKADKSKDVGEALINTLFKNNMLFIYDDPEGENKKLGNELTGLMHSKYKVQKDDLCDALRYCVMLPPWNFEGIGGPASDEEEKIVRKPMTPAELLQDEIRRRRGDFERKDEPWSEIEEDFNFWNSQYGND